MVDAALAPQMRVGASKRFLSGSAAGRDVYTEVTNQALAQISQQGRPFENVPEPVLEALYRLPASFPLFPTQRLGPNCSSRSSLGSPSGARMGLSTWQRCAGPRLLRERPGGPECRRARTRALRRWAPRPPRHRVPVSCPVPASLHWLLVDTKVQARQHGPPV